MTKQEWHEELARIFTKVYIWLAFLKSNQIQGWKALEQRTNDLWFSWVEQEGLMDTSSFRGLLNLFNAVEVQLQTRKKI